MRYRFFTYMMLAGVLIASGCAGGKHQETPGRSASEKETGYRKVFESWTQEKRIYDGLSTKLISEVTFKSSGFRQAYADEYARLYKLEPPEYDKLVLDQQKAAADYNDFVLAAYVAEKKWDDFAKKTSMWKIYLTRDHVEQIRPLEIRKLNKNDPVKDYFYPYVTTWKSIYLVRFPAHDPKTGNRFMDDTQDALSLIMTSVLGSVEFKWNINHKQ